MSLLLAVRTMLNTAGVVTPFARPANTTQYAVGDLVANHATAGSVVPIEIVAAGFPGGEGKISGIRLQKSGLDLTAAAFRVHLFLLAPTSSVGDNGVFAVSNGLAKGYIGSVDITMGQALGDGAFGRAAAGFIFETKKPQTKVYALIEARGTYTPASAETFLLTLELERA